MSRFAASLQILFSAFLLPAQIVDIAPWGQENVRATEGSGQRVPFDSKTPLPELIRRLDGEWREVETGKGYWIGYTDDMFSIAAHKAEAIEPRMQFIPRAKSFRGKIGAIWTLHLIGIESRIAGRYSERFIRQDARRALLSLLVQEDLRESIMLLLIRDPWPSDVPSLMDIALKSKDDAWPIANALHRYGLRGVPLMQPLPDDLAQRTIPLNELPHWQSKDALPALLEGLKTIAGDRVSIEEGLLAEDLRGPVQRSLSRKSISFSDGLQEAVGIPTDPYAGYMDLGNRVQFYVEQGQVHMCSSRTAMQRWLVWWNAQAPEFRNNQRFR